MPPKRLASFLTSGNFPHSPSSPLSPLLPPPIPRPPPPPPPPLSLPSPPPSLPLTTLLSSLPPSPPLLSLPTAPISPLLMLLHFPVRPLTPLPHFEWMPPFIVTRPTTSPFATPSLISPSYSYPIYPPLTLPSAPHLALSLLLPPPFCIVHRAFHRPARRYQRCIRWSCSATARARGTRKTGSPGGRCRSVGHGPRGGRARGAAAEAEGYVFDVAYTSVLKRAIRTLWIVPDGIDRMWLPVHRHWRLNERHYGALRA